MLTATNSRLSFGGRHPRHAGGGLSKGLLSKEETLVLPGARGPSVVSLKPCSVSTASVCVLPTICLFSGMRSDAESGSLRETPSSPSGPTAAWLESPAAAAAAATATAAAAAAAAAAARASLMTHKGRTILGGASATKGAPTTLTTTATSRRSKHLFSSFLHSQNNSSSSTSNSSSSSGSAAAAVPARSRRSKTDTPCFSSLDKEGGAPTADGLLALGAALCEQKKAYHFSLPCPPRSHLLREAPAEGGGAPGEGGGGLEYLGAPQKHRKPISWLKRALLVAVYCHKTRSSAAEAEEGLRLPAAAVGGTPTGRSSNSSSTPQQGGPLPATMRSEVIHREPLAGGPESPGALSDTLLTAEKGAPPKQFTPEALTASLRRGPPKKKGPSEALKEGSSSQEEQEGAPKPQPSAALPADSTGRGPLSAARCGRSGYRPSSLQGPPLGAMEGPPSYACCWLQQQRGGRVWGPPSLEEQKAFFAASAWMPQLFHFIRTVGTGTLGRVFICRLKPREGAPLDGGGTLGGGTPSQQGGGAPPAFCCAIRKALEETPFAIKRLRKCQILQVKQQTHVLNERRILQAMNHPLVVNLFATFQTSTHLFLVMEFVGGGELFSLLNRKGSLRLETARFYAGEVLVALLYVHSLGVIYRDLKPENILIGNDGHVKLVDFGFSKPIEKPRPFLLGGLPVDSAGGPPSCSHPACSRIQSRHAGGGAYGAPPPVFAFSPVNGGAPLSSWGPLEGPSAAAEPPMHKAAGGGPLEGLFHSAGGALEQLANAEADDSKESRSAGGLKKLPTAGALTPRTWEWGPLSEAPTRATTPGTGWSETVSFSSLPTIESSSVEGYLGGPYPQTPLSVSGAPQQTPAHSGVGGPLTPPQMPSLEGGPSKATPRALTPPLQEQMVRGPALEGGERAPRCVLRKEPPCLPNPSVPPGDKGSWGGSLQGAPSTPPVQRQQAWGDGSSPWGGGPPAASSTWMPGGAPPLQQPRQQQKQQQEQEGAALWHSRAPMGDSPGGPSCGEGSEGGCGAPLLPVSLLRGLSVSAGLLNSVGQGPPSFGREEAPTCLWRPGGEETEASDQQGQGGASAPGGDSSPFNGTERGGPRARESWVSILLEENKRDNDETVDRSLSADSPKYACEGPSFDTLGLSAAVAYPAAAATNDSSTPASAAAAAAEAEAADVPPSAAWEGPSAECLSLSLYPPAAGGKQQEQLLPLEDRDPARSCTLCGTSEYMSPETLLRKGQHFSSDAWAFGILLHELVFWQALTKTPFYSEDPSAMYEAIVHQEVRLPHGTPPSLERLLLRLLDKDSRTRLSLAMASRSSFFSSFFSFPRGCQYGHLVPPPFVPSLKGPFDSGAFDSYPESTDEGALNPDQQQHCDSWLTEFQ
ncbi:hypothetical protein Efla_001218 [Eimeria flavescens]